MYVDVLSFRRPIPFYSPSFLIFLFVYKTLIWNRFKYNCCYKIFNDHTHLMQKVDCETSNSLTFKINGVFHWSMIALNKLCMQFVETGKRIPGCLYCRWDRQKITPFSYFYCPWKTKLLDRRPLRLQSKRYYKTFHPYSN